MSGPQPAEGFGVFRWSWVILLGLLLLVSSPARGAWHAEEFPGDALRVQCACVEEAVVRVPPVRVRASRASRDPVRGILPAGLPMLRVQRGPPALA